MTEITRYGGGGSSEQQSTDIDRDGPRLVEEMNHATTDYQMAWIKNLNKQLNP